MKTWSINQVWDQVNDRQDPSPDVERRICVNTVEGATKTALGCLDSMFGDIALVGIWWY